MIAEFLKVVVDVTDLEKGLNFWSELTGLEGAYKDPAGKFMGLGVKQVQGENSSVILLQHVDSVVPGGGTHIDLKVDNVEKAIEKIEKIGGRLKQKTDLYPPGDCPLLEWAVMEDPFGNPFCIIRSPI